MATVIMMFILPIGIIVFYWDLKNYAANIKFFDSHVSKIINLELDKAEKIDGIDKMFRQNGYATVSRTDTTLIVEKKHVNLGVPFIMLGLMAYIGIVVYLIYFYYFLKPRRLQINIENEPFLVVKKYKTWFTKQKKH